MYFSRTSSGFLYPYFSRIFLGSVRLLLNVERVGFVFRMGNASLFANPFFTPRKKCLRASTIPTRR